MWFLHISSFDFKHWCAYFGVELHSLEFDADFHFFDFDFHNVVDVEFSILEYCCDYFWGKFWIRLSQLPFELKFQRSDYIFENDVDGDVQNLNCFFIYFDGDLTLDVHYFDSIQWNCHVSKIHQIQQVKFHGTNWK